MKVLVIPDVHLKPCLFDYADNILKSGKADMAVCLMDIPDDWNKQFYINLYSDIYDRAIKFAKDHPDTLWCYGNHDISYLWGKWETGYSPYAERTVINKIGKLEKTLKDHSQIAFIHRIDNVLFSHGGLNVDFLRWFDESLINADIDDVIAAINNAPRDVLWDDRSPIWYRPQYVQNVKAFRSNIYKQVVGHTPVKKIYEKDGFISTDVFSKNSRGNQIGESAMVVIDSMTQDWRILANGQLYSIRR